MNKDNINNTNNVVKLSEWIAKNPIKALNILLKVEKIDDAEEKRRIHNDKVLKKHGLGKYKSVINISNDKPSA